LTIFASFAEEDSVDMAEDDVETVVLGREKALDPTNRRATAKRRIL